MDKSWLLGFMEASGCFSVVIRKSQNQVGYQTTADFTLKLPAHQRPLLEEIQGFLNVGKIYQNKSESLLKVTRLEDAKSLVKFFSSEHLVSEEKRKEFSVWSSCVDMMDKGLHLTAPGVLEIARLRDSIHMKHLWNKKNYCSLRVEIDPCHVYEKTRQLPEGCRICWGEEFRHKLVNIPIKISGGN